ncbi:MAG TPA: hypothetical protein VIF82_10190 [Burkholderiaceae bacterium]|jgi:hypothetical protein
MPELTVIKDEYTRRVSGETFQYEAQFNVGDRVEWSARVYLNGKLKGEPKGCVIDNTMDKAELKQYIIAYIEGIIERGIGLEE